MLKTIVARLSCCCVVLIGAGQANGATLEVGPGSDYATIQGCINVARPGDICEVRAGIYYEQLRLSTNGTSGAPIVLRNRPGEQVTVAAGQSPVLDISGADHWVLDGVDIVYTGTGSGPVGINNNNCLATDFVTIRNLVITMQGGAGTSGAGLKVMCSDHLTVANVTIAVTASAGVNVGINGCVLLLSSHLQFVGNTVYGNASEGAGKLQDGCVASGTNLSITDNSFYDGWAYDRHPDGIVIQGDGDRLGNPTTDVTVARNVVRNFSAGIFVDAIHKPIEGTNCICNNVVYETPVFRYGGVGNKMNGIVVTGYSIRGGTWPVSVSVSNNTVDVRQQVIGIGSLGVGSNVSVANNLLMRVAYGSVQVDSPGVNIDYNYYHSSNATPIRWQGVVYSVVSFSAAGLGEGHAGAGVVTINADYSLASASATRCAGVNLSELFTTDFARKSRPAAPAKWDIGAFQYDSSASCPSVSAPRNVRLSAQ